jgi:hypothetical protein
MQTGSAVNKSQKKLIFPACVRKQTNFLVIQPKDWRSSMFKKIWWVELDEEYLPIRYVRFCFKIKG